MVSSRQLGYKAPASQKATEERNKEATSPFGEYRLGVWSFLDTPEHAQSQLSSTPNLLLEKMSPRKPAGFLVLLSSSLQLPHRSAPQIA